MTFLLCSPLIDTITLRVIMFLTLIAAFLDGEMFRLNSHPLTFDHLIVTGPTHHYHIRAIRKIHGCSICSGQDPSQINHISLS